MPELILFAACEKVITDTDGLVSLITIIERLEVTVPAGVDLPPNAAVPQRWQVVAIWTLEESDLGRYEQKIDLVVANGSVAMHTEPQVLQSPLPGRTGVKIISTITVVPIAEGLLRLKIFLRKIGDQEWKYIASYPLNVTLVRQ